MLNLIWKKMLHWEAARIAALAAQTVREKSPYLSDAEIEVEVLAWLEDMHHGAEFYIKISPSLMKKLPAREKIPKEVKASYETFLAGGQCYLNKHFPRTPGRGYFCRDIALENYKWC
jgi:hypothetical protein